MKHFLFLFAILFIGSSFKPTNQTQNFDFYFLEDEAILTGKSKQALLEVAKYANQFETPNLSIEVPPNDDEELSRTRLDLLLFEFEELDLSIERILFYSSSEHLSEDLKDLATKNAIRVIVDEIIEEEPAITEKINPLENKEITEIQAPKWAQPIVNYQKNAKEFNISNFASARLRTRDGSIIRIEPESFVYLDGSIVTAPIDIVTKYATTKNIAILEELTTVSDNEILESRGMMYINATANGQQLRLAKPIKIEIEAKEIEEDFQPFVGARNRNTGIMNWSLDNEMMALINQALAKRHKYYKYEKLSDEKRADFIAYRNEQIGIWEEKGYDKKRIKQKLKSAKQYARNRERNKKDYYKRRSAYTNNYEKKRRKKDFDLVKKSAKSTANIYTKKYKLGIPKYEFVQYEKILPPGANEGLFILRSSYLGWHNVDRMMRRIQRNGPPCDLIVKANKNENVKIVFDRFFTVLKGIPCEKGFIFKNVPKDVDVTVLSATKSDNGSIIKFAQTKCKISTEIVHLSNYRNLTSEQYTRLIEKMVI